MNNKKAMSKSCHVFPVGEKATNKSSHVLLGNNKKATIGETISWFVAIIAIFLILIIFFIFSGLIGAKLGYSDKATSPEKETSLSYFNLRGAVVFLESPHEGMTIRESMSSSASNPPIRESEIFTEIDCYNACANFFPDKLSVNCVRDRKGVDKDKRILVDVIDLDKRTLKQTELLTMDKLNFGAYYGC